MYPWTGLIIREHPGFRMLCPQAHGSSCLIWAEHERETGFLRKQSLCKQSTIHLQGLPWKPIRDCRRKRASFDTHDQNLTTIRLIIMNCLSNHLFLFTKPAGVGIFAFEGGKSIKIMNNIYKSIYTVKYKKNCVYLQLLLN